MAPADARPAGCDFMKEAGAGWQAIPRLHAVAVLASELAGTANARNPDSGVPTPSAPALPFPSDNQAARVAARWNSRRLARRAQRRGAAGVNTGEKPHWAFQISVHKWFILLVGISRRRRLNTLTCTRPRVSPCGSAFGCSTERLPSRLVVYPSPMRRICG